MGPIRGSIDISRRPEDVFSYMVDPSHLPEWQENVVSARRMDDGPPKVGTKVVVTRRVGPREQAMSAELVELDPPRSWATRGLDGPVRGHVKGTIEPLGEESSRLTIALEFEAGGCCSSRACWPAISSA